jgi:hypothetical protein
MSWDAAHSTTLSEKAYRAWAIPTTDESGFESSPRLTNVKERHNNVSALILTDNLDRKIQLALALGRSYRQACISVGQKKIELSIERADNTS